MLGIALMWSLSGPSNAEAQTIETRLQGVVNSYLKNMQPSEWLLEKKEEFVTPQLKATFTEARETLLSAMNAWCPTNTLGLTLRDWLPSWSWVIANKVGSNNEVSGGLTVIEGKEIVLLVPKEISLQLQPISFFCNKEAKGKLIFIKAYKMPPQIYAAFTLHEAGHAERYWRQKKPDSMSEEVLMHALSSDILDVYAQGEYKKAARRIVIRDGNAAKQDFRKAFAHLTDSDLAELDRIIGNTGTGQEIGCATVVQHLLTIGFEAIDQQGGGIDQKTEVYDWVESLHTRSF